MTPDQRDAFLRATRIAKLASLNADGSPTIVPIWFEWDGETAAIFTGGASLKVRRIERDPRVALSVEDGVGLPEAWVTIDGLAEIQTDGAFELAVRLAGRYYQEPRRSEALAQWRQGQLAIIRIRPTRIRSRASGST